MITECDDLKLISNLVKVWLNFKRRPKLRPASDSHIPCPSDDLIKAMGSSRSGRGSGLGVRVCYSIDVFSEQRRVLSLSSMYS